MNENSDTSFFIIKMERIRVIGMSGANALDRFKEHVDLFGGTIEYWHQAHNKKAPCKAFVLINKMNSNAFVRSVRTDRISKFIVVYSMGENEVSLPARDLVGRQELTPENLRIGRSVPHVTDKEVNYPIDSKETLNMVYSVYDDFNNHLDWTHFVCFPIAPCFPSFRDELKECFRRWSIDPANDKLCDRFHVTVILFVLHNDEEINLMDQLIKETVEEIEWPENRTVTFPKLNYFGDSPDQATILYADPEGDFVNAVSEAVHILSEKARDHGFTRMYPSNVLHGTWVRPYCIGGPKAKTFDARPLIDSYDPTWLSPIEASELRLVKRKVWAEDGFYHTERVYKVYEM